MTTPNNAGNRDVEHAVRCTDGWTTAPLRVPYPEKFAAYLDTTDAHRRCGPHVVVQRAVGPWEPAQAAS